jgi:aldose 1-epimerase
LNADRYTVVDADLIPTGEIKSIAGSPLDFRRPAPLGARAGQLAPGRRYDHNFVLNRRESDASLIFAARVREPRSGRVMEVWTTEPGVQLYTSVLTTPAPNDPSPRAGFLCLETQYFPDAVNHPHFPSTILRPGQEFRSATEFRFSVK